MKKQCVVIIPIYQKILNEYEKQSVINTIDKFHNLFDILFMTYESFDIDKFYIENNIDEKYKINYVYYKDKFFTNIDSYNQLFFDRSFYAYYSQTYQYMLIVQTDAYVFDQYKILDYINKGYMFIGAPVIPPNWDDLLYECNRGIYYNGGLSLRNIEKCIECLDNKEYIEFFYANNTQYDEDILFSIYEQLYEKSPTYLEALQFAIDNQFKMYAPILNLQKPFGVHHFFNDDDNGDNKLNLLKKLKWI